MKLIERDLVIETLSSVLASLLKEIKNRADFIILLAHCDLRESRRLAETFPALNLIVSGHAEEEVLVEPVVVGKTLIVNPGIKGKHLGELKLTFDDNTILT